MNIIFVSSKNRGTGQKREQKNRPRTVQISVPSKLVMDLLSQGAILQVQIGPVPLRPDLARPASRPERPESTNTRPETSNTRPNVAAENTRQNPSGRSETGLTRPERPLSRHPPARSVSPYTDCSSLSDNDVISVHSDGSDANYVPRSLVYEPDSPGPVQERENWVPTNGEEAQEETVVSSIFDSRNRTSDRDAIDSNERPRSPLGSGTLLQRVSPFLRGIGQRRRHNLGKIRPM